MDFGQYIFIKDQIQIATFVLSAQNKSKFTCSMFNPYKESYLNVKDKL